MWLIYGYFIFLSLKLITILIILGLLALIFGISRQKIKLLTKFVNSFTVSHLSNILIAIFGITMLVSIFLTGQFLSYMRISYAHQYVLMYTFIDGCKFIYKYFSRADELQQKLLKYKEIAYKYIENHK